MFKLILSHLTLKVQLEVTYSHGLPKKIDKLLIAMTLGSATLQKKSSMAHKLLLFSEPNLKK